MRISRPRVTFARPADNTAYQAGDEVSNHATAGSVVRATIDMAGFRRGKIRAASIDLTPGSGNVITTASDFELLVFKTANVPAAVGDNVTHPIAAAVRTLAVAAYRFDDAGWTGPLGTVAAGTSQLQCVTPSLVHSLGTPVLQYPWQDGNPFEFTQDEAKTFTLVLRTLAAWTPTGIINTFGITLDILELEI